MQKLISLQYLRALAATAVLVHHFSGAFGYQTRVGAAGVDVFFIISGFVMALVTTNHVTALRFLRDRIIRIVPMYWICTLFLYFCVSLRPNLFPLDVAELGHLLKSLFFIPHISPLGSTFPLVIQGWTLIYEMFFYGIFAMALTISQQNRLLITTAAITILLVLGACIRSDSLAVETFTSPLMLEFVSGLWMYEVYRSGRMPSLEVCVALIAFSLVAFAIEELLPSVSAPKILLFGVPALCLFTGCLGLEGRIPLVRLILLVGDASYSIYLTNWFSLLFIVLVGAKFGIVRDGWPVIFASFPAAIILGIIAYRFVEMPVMGLLRHRIPQPAVL